MSHIFKNISNKSDEHKVLHIIKILQRDAKDSSLYHKHAALIISPDGRILARSSNYRMSPNQIESIHAEQAVLSVLKGKHRNYKYLRKCTMYVIRISNTEEGVLKLSKPCKKCERKIIESGIGKIFYSVNNLI